MRTATPALLTCFALAVGSSPLRSEQLYVPLTNYPGDGTTLELLVTNMDESAAHVFSGTILAESSDGTLDPGTPTEAITVEPGTTRVIKGPPGTGLWRLDGYMGLEVGARMKVPTGVSSEQGAEVPILSSDSVHAAGSTAVVQSLLAASGYLSDFALFNAGEQSARCEATIKLRDGTQIGPDYLLHVAPLSLNVFENVASVAVVPGQVSNIRISMTCDQAFFVYSRTVNPQTGYLAIHTSATALADGLPTPGSEDPTPTTEDDPPPPPPPTSDDAPPPAGQTTRFTRNGKFFTASNGNPNLVLTMGVAADVVYSQFHVSFDVKHGGWNRNLPDGIHNLVYITRGGWSGDVFTLVTARGPNKNIVRNEITVDLPKNEVSQKTVGANLQPGTTYHLDYLYNHKARKWRVTITAGGATAVDFSGPTTGPIWTKNGSWRIFLSDQTTAAHVTSLGWEYSNLQVEWIP